MVDIIHLSDLHFGSPQNTFNWEEISSALSKYILENSNDPVIVVSGDVTIRGKIEGYEIASIFFNKLISSGVVNPKNVCICPGNHDILGNSFKSFDNFLYSIRRDHNLDFSSNNFRVIPIKDVVFVLFNSSYHLNHTYGLIDDICFDIDLSEYRDMKKVLVFHHHILNQFDGDTSAIRNGYDLLQFIEKNTFSLILHGHQHAEQIYYLAKNSTPVISARSGNFNQSGYLNAFNHYKIQNDEVIISNLVFEKSSRGVSVIKFTR